MNTLQQIRKQFLMASAALFIAGNAGLALSEEVGVLLAGNQETPQVVTNGSGSGRFTVGTDGSVSGSVTTLNIAGTAAHIHEGAIDKNGPVIIPLTKGKGTTWTVPAGAKLTADQMTSFKAGQLYVNVHTEKNKGGEVRGQLIPK